MLFNSYIFIFVFLPFALGSYLIARRISASLALACAIATSLVFYAYWDINYVPLLCVSILVNYGLGTIILGGAPPHARAVVAFAIVLNLAALAYFKYANFVAAQFGLTLDKIALPLAVSFYTFQQIAYLVDCYRGKIHDNAFLRYAFTVTFFPHLIAGPIVRMREIAPQFPNLLNRSVLTDLCVGLAVFVIGLGKKVLIADYFGQIASPIFAGAQQNLSVDAVTAWTGALAYTLQLYFDFSGYSDMAIGLSRMFGFRLAVNFLSPYKAASIAEFWRRWHITLSRFLRDYLFIPLGGSRAGSARVYANLLITMGLGGLWHGAAWTFVAWGLYHGALLCLHRVWRLHGFPAARRGLRPVSVLFTFLCVVIGWVLFRSPDFTTAWAMLKGMASMSGLGVLRDGREIYFAIGAGLAACWLLPNVYQIFFGWRPALILAGQIPMAKPPQRRARYVFRFRPAEAAVIASVLLGCLYTMRSSISEFLYFMF